MRGNPLIFPVLGLISVLGLAAAAVADERVTYPSFDEDITEDGKPTRIDARLYRPSGDGPFPAVVGMHGCGGRDLRTRDAPMSVQGSWAERLSALGYVVLLPDSFRPRGIDEVCTKSPQPVTTTKHRPRDAWGAARWLRTQTFVRSNDVFLMGWSHGGGTTLATIRVDNFQTLRDRAGGPFRAAVAFYPGCVTQLQSGWKTATPLLILTGELDDWTPAKPCRELAAKPMPHRIEYVEYAEAFHGFDAPNTKLRQRTDVTGARRNGKGAVTIGTNPAARDDALSRVPEFLAVHRVK